MHDDEGMDTDLLLSMHGRQAAGPTPGQRHSATLSTKPPTPSQWVLGHCLTTPATQLSTSAASGM